MMVRLRKRLSLGLALALSALVGVLGGGGVALASDAFLDLASGYQYKYAYHSYSFGGLAFDYFQRNYVYRSADSTQVQLHSGDPDGTYYYEGWANSNNLLYGPLYIADELNYHNVYYSTFEWTAINGVNRFGNTAWYYGSLNSTNNYVDMWQYIWYWDPGSGLDTIELNLTSFYTGIGTRR